MSESISIKDLRTITEYLKSNGPTPIKEPNLLDKLDLEMSQCKTLERKFQYLEKEFILQSSYKGKAKHWILIDKGILNTTMTEKDASTFEYIIELNRKDFSPDMVKTLKHLYSSNEHITGLLSIAESLENRRLEEYYNTIMDAIRKQKYLKMKFTHPEMKYSNVKPIKMVFSDDNWYVAFAYKNDDDADEGFKLGRLSFIDNISEDIYKDKTKFQKKSLKPYLDFLKNDLQNTRTIYAQDKKVARLRATSSVSQYFKEDMKKFFKSQKFEEHQEDGSVLFSVEYTQDLEILPFVQKWMPDILIVEPKELKDSYMKKLNEIQSLMERDEREV